MQYKLKEKKDIKIFILYLLSCIDKPLTYNELSDIVVQDEIVNWFDCAECIGELVDAGNIGTTTDEQGDLVYSITEQGRNVSNVLESDIGSYIRTQGRESAERYLFNRATGRLKTITESRDDGRIDVTFLLFMEEEQVMELKVIADNRYHAALMEQAVKSNPPLFYGNIKLMLFGASPISIKRKDSLL